MFLCRSCLFFSPESHGSGTPCPRCSSRRVIIHPELSKLTLAHVDCDAFFAAIEKRDHPELADKPVIVGGGQRGVVSTCCYIARLYGVRSAMPMFKALQLCPDATVIRGNYEKYRDAGLQIRDMMQNLTPLVEPLSIDEAFLDLSGTERYHGKNPAQTLATFAKDVFREVGITVSIGLSHNKFLAKLASDLRKPDGFCVIGREETEQFLSPLPVTHLWGVGKVSSQKLIRDGYHTLGDLQKTDAKILGRRYGDWGLHLKNMAHGRDTRSVKTDRVRKSLSKETTFDTDIAEFEALKQHLKALSHKVSRRLRQQKMAGQTVTLKLKTKDFKSRTRSVTLDQPTQLAYQIFQTALPLLEKEMDGTSFRLIGVGMSHLVEDDQADLPDLVNTKIQKHKQLERALDHLKQRHEGVFIHY
jgi:DNA polymerase-4